MITAFRALNSTNMIVSAVAFLAAAGATNSALACRIPWRFVPANEDHEVVVVATALRRDDWGRFDYTTGSPVVRETGYPFRFLHARQWTAELRTLWVLKGEAIPIIQVAPDLLASGQSIDDVGVSSCWDGIETPQPGKTYAVYLDRRDGALKTTRLVDINFALANDPLFLSATTMEHVNQ